MSLVIPLSPPPPKYPKLATMTVNTEIPSGLNLNVISTHIRLTPEIIAIKYEDNIVYETIVRGDEDSTPKGHFQHQSTFIIQLDPIDVNDTNRYIHMKVFNNGKLGIINCRARDEGDHCANILLDSIQNIEGEMTCKIPYDPRIVFNDDSEHKALQKGAKDFEESSIYPKIASMIKIKLGFLSRLTGRTKKDRLAILSTYFHTKPDQMRKYILVYKLRQLYNIYYPDSFFDEYVKGEGSYRIIEQIMSNMDTSDPDTHKSTITCPAYLNNDVRLVHNPSLTYIGMINSTCSVCFYMNIGILFEILRQSTDMTVTYTPDRYRAIICKYLPTADRSELVRKNKDRRITLIIFAKGPINITAAVTWDQVIESYDMIRNIIHEHFDTILYMKLYKQLKAERIQKIPNVYKLIQPENEDDSASDEQDIRIFLKYATIFTTNRVLLESLNITRYEDLCNDTVLTNLVI